MNISLKRKDGTIVKGKIKVLDESYIDKIMILQDEVNKGILHKEWYASTSREEFYIQLTNMGEIVGCVLEDDTLIALGAYAEWKYEEHNYGYDLGIEKERLLSVGQIEATLVHENFRGNKLQKKICIELEKIAISRGRRVIAVTVHPENVYSLRTFRELKYESVTEKLKYGGLKRLILMKNI